MTDRAAQEIRLRIVRGVFQLGEPLSEVALATELNVSKTPVREALMKLKGEGLVEVHPQRGTFVFALTAEQVGKLSELRAILESAALRLTLTHNPAALAGTWAGIVDEMKSALEGADAERYRRLDGAFHRAMFDLAQNDYLLDTFNMIAFRLQALRNRLSLAPALNQTSFEEHVTMLRLVRTGSSEEVGSLLVRHIEWTCAQYLAELDRPAGLTAEPRSRARRRSAKG